MKLARKTIAWTLIGSTLLWTACGKEEKKQKVSSTPAKAETLDKAAPPPDANLNGFWLRTAPTLKGKVEQTTIWRIQLSEDPSSKAGKLTIHSICVKDRDTTEVFETIDIQVSRTDLAPQKLNFSKDANPQGDRRNPFAKGECVINSENIKIYAIEVTDLKLKLKNGTREIADMCRLKEVSEGNETKLVTADNCGDKKISITTRQLLRRDAKTTTGAARPATTELKANEILELSRYWIADSITANGIKLDDYIQISKDQLTLLRYCTTDKEQVSATVTAKIKLTDKEIEILEEKTAKAENTELNCEAKLSTGKLEYSLEDKNAAVKVKFADGQKTFKAASAD